MLIDTDKLEDVVIPKINSCKKELKLAGIILNSVKAPDGFENIYKIKSAAKETQRIIKEIENIRKIVEEDISGFNYTETEILNQIIGIGAGALNKAESLIDALDFARQTILENAYKLMTKTPIVNFINNKRLEEYINKSRNETMSRINTGYVENYFKEFYSKNKIGIALDDKSRVPYKSTGSETQKYKKIGTLITTSSSVFCGLGPAIVLNGISKNIENKDRKILISETFTKEITKSLLKSIAGEEKYSRRISLDLTSGSEILEESLIKKLYLKNNPSGQNRIYNKTIANTIRYFGEEEININEWNIKSIKENQNSTYVTLYDGTQIVIDKGYQGNDTLYISFTDGMKITVKKDGEKTIIKNNEVKAINFSNEDFHGNQMSFKYNNASLSRDSKMQTIIKSYWPKAKNEDIELLLYKICSSGCGYISCTNTLFEQYKGKEEKFEKKFGFPMYQEGTKGKKDYNYEYIAADFFGYVWGKYKGYDIQDIYQGIEEDTTDVALGGIHNKKEEISTGSNEFTFLIFSDFLKEKYDINVDIKVLYQEDFNKTNYEIRDNTVDVEIYKRLKNKNKNKYVLIGVEGSNLYREDECTINVGPHSMYITGVENNGKNLKVSSWGEEWDLDLSDFNIDEHIDSYSHPGEDFIQFTTIEYHLD